jgi:hypothetical protein
MLSSTSSHCCARSMRWRKPLAHTALADVCAPREAVGGGASRAGQTGALVLEACRVGVWGAGQHARCAKGIRCVPEA